jgi:hypothetical protein
LTAKVNRRAAMLGLAATPLAGCAPRADGQATSGALIRAAEREGEVVV